MTYYEHIKSLGSNMSLAQLSMALCPSMLWNSEEEKSIHKPDRPCNDGKGAGVKKCSACWSREVALPPKNPIKYIL